MKDAISYQLQICTRILQSGETVRLDPGARCECLAGTVWITDRGRDVILHSGASYCSNDARQAVIATNPGHRPVTIRLAPGDPHGCQM